ncbi:LOW QUALITY PROTEIN: hypothetical protein QC761_400180 [Podospora bellae-mahoneyi]|uniref:Uncharacterized protein n=1 Tax=Podospora bellae-mahoneyi TaxID=2093777 RepID=A0ABR0FFI0_9PEZI|nr:LOW QUALITY PROTEIN: hypothetical protein QC761_400180 [Podospora bellae-mahoneyi]
MVEEIMAGPLGYALLSTILQVSWGTRHLRLRKRHYRVLTTWRVWLGVIFVCYIPASKAGKAQRRGRVGQVVVQPGTRFGLERSEHRLLTAASHAGTTLGRFLFPVIQSVQATFDTLRTGTGFIPTEEGMPDQNPPLPPGFTARSASSHSPHPPISSPKDAQYLATHWLPVREETLRVLRKRRSLWTKTRSRSTTQESPSSPVYVEIPKKTVNPEVHAVEIFLDIPHGMPGEWPSHHTPSRNRRRTPPPPIPVSPGTVKVRITGPKPTSTSDYIIALPETPPGRGRPPPPDRQPTKLNREAGEEAGKTPTSTGNEPQKGNRHGTGALSTPPHLTQTRPPSPWTGPGSSTEWNQSHLTADQRIVLLKYVAGGRPRVFHELVGPGESIEKTDDGIGKGTGKPDDPTPLPNKEKDRLDTMGRLGSYLRDTWGLSSTTR